MVVVVQLAQVQLQLGEVSQFFVVLLSLVDVGGPSSLLERSLEASLVLLPYRLRVLRAAHLAVVCLLDVLLLWVDLRGVLLLQLISA